MRSTRHCQPDLSRRDLLRAGAATAAGLLAVNPLRESPSGAADPDDAGWIDAHSHIWTPDTDRYPLEGTQTKADLAPPSFTDEELLAIAGPEGVRRVVLIQHNIYHGFDNSYLVDTWKQHPDRFRVVGMVDSRKPDPGTVMRTLLRQGVTGFRITPFRLGTDWLDTPGMHEMWRTAVQTRQAMCCLCNPSDLPSVDRMCGQHPDTPVVVDHFGRVGADGTIRDEDVAALCRLARHPRVHVKVSAYYALGKKQPPYDDLIPMIRRCYDAFGPRRLMWASDCPYQLGGNHTYAASIALIRDRIEWLTAEDRQWLLRKTAEAVYFFDA